MQEPCDGPKMATTPSANWSQATTEEGDTGSVRCYVHWEWAMSLTFA